MARAKVYGLDGKKGGGVVLPKVFSAPFRPDVIHRVYVALSTHRIQPQGRDLMAGERTSAVSWGAGFGRARVARVKGERHPRATQAAGIAGVVKGRIAHPPRAETVVRKEVNRKERRLALASSIAASAHRELVMLRGHRADRVPAIPLIVSDEIQSVKKAKDLKAVFEKLGLDDDLVRVARRQREPSGKAKMRGRGQKGGRGPLIVVAKDDGISKASRNFPGVECVLAKDLSVLHLAPGGQSGRLVVWSRSAPKALSKAMVEVMKVAA